MVICQEIGEMQATTCLGMVTDSSGSSPWDSLHLASSTCGKGTIRSGNRTKRNCHHARSFSPRKSCCMRNVNVSFFIPLFEQVVERDFS